MSFVNTIFYLDFIFLLLIDKVPIIFFRKWLPGSGLNLIHPKLNPEDHFEKFSIFTKFKDLSPQQILAVFR